LLKSNEDASFADSIEATMNGDTVFTIQDQSSPKDPGVQQDPNNPGQNPGNPTPSPSPNPKKKTSVIVPWWGWLGLAAVAGGIAAGVATDGGQGSAQNRVSSPQP
jgi:hypothetical protein